MELIGVPVFNFQELAAKLKPLGIACEHRSPTTLAAVFSALPQRPSQNCIAPLVCGCLLPYEIAAALPRYAHVVYVYPGRHETYSLIAGTVPDLIQTSVRMTNADEYPIRVEGAHLIELLRKNIHSQLFDGFRRITNPDGSISLRENNVR